MTRIFLDSAPLIYLTERADAPAAQVQRQLAQWIERGDALVTSSLTLLELLVHPKRRGDLRLESKYRALLATLLSDALVPLDERVAELAAQLRATHKLATPDAIQAGCAIASGCDIFYTNDKQFMKVPEFTTLLCTA